MIEEVEIQEPEQQQQPDPPKKKLWSKLNTDKLYTKSYEEFEQQFNTSEKVDKLYQTLSSQQLYTKSKQEFEQQFFAPETKKKSSSIVFEESSLQAGNALSQSNGVGGEEIPTIEMYTTPNGEMVEANPIALSKKYRELSNRTKQTDVTVGSGFGMGTTGNTTPVPDEDAQKSAKKLKEDFPNIDFEGISDEIKDIPDEVLSRVGGELMQDREQNNPLYQRKLANIKWRSGLEQEILNDVDKGNITPENYNRIKESIDKLPEFTGSGDFSNQRGAVKSLAQDIQLYGGENKDKILQNFAIEVSKVYGSAYNNNFENTIKDSPESKYLNSDEQLALQYLKDVAPDKAGQYDRLLIDPKTLKDNPEALKGYNHLKQTLEETGIGLQQNAVTEELNNLKRIANRDGGLTPEQLEKATQLETKQEELTQKRNELDKKYPERISDKAMDAVNEVMGKDINWGEYAMVKTGQAFYNTGQGIWEAVSTPFMSDASNMLRELAIMGDNLESQKNLKQPDRNIAILNDKMVIEPELQTQVDAIKNNKLLTDEQKRRKLHHLFYTNTDKFGRVPIKGGKWNLNPASIGYSLTDLGTTLIPFIALETVTGGGATAGLARKFMTTFTAAAATTFHDEYAAAIEKGSPNPYKEAMGMTAISSLAMAGAATPSKIKAMVNPKTSAGKLILSMSDDAIQKVLDKGVPKGLKAIGNRLKATPKMVGGGLKTGAEFEVAMTAANELKHQIYDTEIDREANFKHSLLAIGNFGIMGGTLGQFGYKSPTEMQKGAGLLFGEKPKDYISVAEEMRKNGQLTETEFNHRVELINQFGDAYKSVPKNLNEKQKADYLYQTVIKNEANKGKSDLPPKQAAAAEKTALVADHTRGLILEPPTDKQLNDRKGILERKLEPKKDAEGKAIEIPEKEKLDYQAELEAINNEVETRKSFEKVEMERKDIAPTNPIKQYREKNKVTEEMVSDDALLQNIAEQAQNITGGKENQTGDAKSLYDATVKQAGKELVDLAISKYPKEKLLSTTPTEVKGKDVVVDEGVVDKPKDFISDMKGKGFVLENGEYKRNGIGLNIKREKTLFVDSNGDVSFGESPNPKDIVLNEIKVIEESARGKGEATKALDDFLETADSHGYTIYIEPAPIKKLENKSNLTKEQLIKWYEKRGFEKKNDDIWVRKPKEQSISTNKEVKNEAKDTEVPNTEKKGSDTAPTVSETPPKTESGKGGKEPPQEPNKPVEGEGGNAGITQAANAVRRMDRQMAEFEKIPQSFEQWNNEAEAALKKGYDVEALMDRLEKNPTAATPVENAIRKIYIATLDAEIAKNPTDALLAKQKRFVQIGDAVNRIAGQQLVSLKGQGNPLSTISDFYVAKMEAIGADKLTDAQKAEVQKDFETVTKRAEEAEAKLAEANAKFAEMMAEKEFGKAKSTTKKKTKGDFVTERKQIKESISEKLRKARGETSAVVVPYAKELIAIAPDVAKLMKSYIEEGVVNLKEVVKRIHDELKPVMPEIKEKDIHDIIAGEYNTKKPTRNKLAAIARDLKDEAVYINKLERLLAGEEPKTEKAKVLRNQQITELKNKIAEFKKEETAANKFYGESDAWRMKIERMEDELDRIRERREKAPAKSKAELTTEEIELKKQIAAERKQWNNENSEAKNVIKLVEELDRVRNRMDKPDVQPKEKRELSAREKGLKKEIAKEQRKWATEKNIDRLEKELDRLQNRLPKEPSTTVKKELTDKEKELKDAIAAERKVIAAEERAANKFYREELYPEVRKMYQAIARNEAQTKKIKEDLVNENYEKTPRPKSIYESKEFKEKHPQLFKDLLDSQNKMHEAKLEFERKLIEEEMKNYGLGDKIRAGVKKTSGTLKHLFASFDLSSIAVQNLPMILTNPVIGGKGVVHSMKEMVSQKEFDRYLTELHKSSDWNVIKDSGLRVTEPKSLLDSGREDFFPTRFKAIVTIKGKQYGYVKIGNNKYELLDISKPFERQFTSLGNWLRVVKFRTEAEKLYNKGITFEKHPEEFKTLATRINNLTSSADVPMAYQNEVTRTFIWSTRLMAAKLNMLGISDVAALIPGSGVKKGYYRSLGIKGQKISRQQAYAAADLAKFATGVMAATYLYAMGSGGTVNTDPDSNGFLDVENGTKSTNFTGGFGRYISLMVQMYKGGKRNPLTGKFEKYSTYKDPVKEGFAFIGQKAPPVTSSTLNVLAGKDMGGNEADVTTEASKYTMPLAVGQIVNQVDRDGYSALFKDGLLTLIGINSRDRRDYVDQDTDMPEWKFLAEKKLRLVNHKKETLKPLTEDGKPVEVTEEKYQQFIKKREDIVKQEIKDLMNEGAKYEDEEGEVIEIPASKVKEIEPEEIKKWLMNTTKKATEKAIEEIWGEQPKVPKKPTLKTNKDEE